MMTQQDIIDVVESSICPVLLEIPAPDNAAFLVNMQGWANLAEEGYLTSKYAILDRPTFAAHFAANRVHPVTGRLLGDNERVLEYATLLLDMKMLAAYQAINENAKRAANILPTGQAEEPRYVYPDNEPQKVSNYLNARPQAALNAARDALNLIIQNTDAALADLNATPAELERARYFRVVNADHLTTPVPPITTQRIFVEGADNHPLPAAGAAVPAALADTRIRTQRIYAMRFVTAARIMPNAAPNNLAVAYRDEIVATYVLAVQNKGVGDPMPLMSTIAKNVIETRLRNEAVAVVDTAIPPMADAAERTQYIDAILKERADIAADQPMLPMTEIARRYVTRNRGPAIIAQALAAANVRDTRRATYTAVINHAIDQVIAGGNAPDVANLTAQFLNVEQQRQNEANQRMTLRGVVDAGSRETYGDAILNQFFNLVSQGQNPVFNNVADAVIRRLQRRDAIRGDVASAGIAAGADQDAYVDAIVQAYEPLVAAGGAPNIYAFTREQLAQRYAATAVVDPVNNIPEAERLAIAAEIVRQYLAHPDTQDVVNADAPQIAPIAANAIGLIEQRLQAAGVPDARKPVYRAEIIALANAARTQANPYPNLPAIIQGVIDNRRLIRDDVNSAGIVAGDQDAYEDAIAQAYAAHVAGLPPLGVPQNVNEFTRRELAKRYAATAVVDAGVLVAERPAIEVEIVRQYMADPVTLDVVNQDAPPIAPIAALAIGSIAQALQAAGIPDAQIPAYRANIIAQADAARAGGDPYPDLTAIIQNVIGNRGLIRGDVIGAGIVVGEQEAYVDAIAQAFDAHVAVAGGGARDINEFTREELAKRYAEQAVAGLPAVERDAIAAEVVRQYRADGVTLDLNQDAPPIAPIAANAIGLIDQELQNAAIPVQQRPDYRAQIIALSDAERTGGTPYPDLQAIIQGVIDNRRLIRGDVDSAGIPIAERDAYEDAIAQAYDVHVANPPGLGPMNINEFTREEIAERYANQAVLNNAAIAQAERAIFVNEIRRQYMDDADTQDVVNEDAPPIAPIADEAMRCIDHPIANAGISINRRPAYRTETLRRVRDEIDNNGVLFPDIPQIVADVIAEGQAIEARALHNVRNAGIPAAQETRYVDEILEEVSEQVDAGTLVIAGQPANVIDPTANGVIAYLQAVEQREAAARADMVSAGIPAAHIDGMGGYVQMAIAQFDIEAAAGGAPNIHTVARRVLADDYARQVGIMNGINAQALLQAFRNDVVQQYMADARTQDVAGDAPAIAPFANAAVERAQVRDMVANQGVNEPVAQNGLVNEILAQRLNSVNNQLATGTPAVATVAIANQVLMQYTGARGPAAAPAAAAPAARPATVGGDLYAQVRRHQFGRNS